LDVANNWPEHLHLSVEDAGLLPYVGDQVHTKVRALRVEVGRTDSVAVLARKINRIFGGSNDMKGIRKRNAAGVVTPSGKMYGMKLLIFGRATHRLGQPSPRACLNLSGGPARL